VVKIASAVAVLALVIATGLAAGAARATTSAAPTAVPCTTSALGEAFTGALALRSFQAWGCAGDFAYAWATIGSEPNEISVTEVLHIDPSAGRWAIVSRLTYCRPGALPEPIYRRGCFSN
jgi:hypothetical protein